MDDGREKSVLTGVKRQSSIKATIRNKGLGREMNGIQGRSISGGRFGSFNFVLDKS
jgi:hypothetical protein